jgi:hypothetical protein
MKPMAGKKYSLYNEAMGTADELVVEVGESHLALVCGSAARVAGFEYYDTSDNTLEEALDLIKQESRLLDGNHTETKIIYNTPEAVLVAVAHFSAAVATDLVDAAFGEKARTRVQVEHVNGTEGIVNVYRNDVQWQELLNTHFRVVDKRHLFSQLLEKNTGGNVYAVFYQDQVALLIRSNGLLEVMRSFSRGDDPDVLYHLLNTCRQVGIDPAATPVSVAGFIDPASQLYKWLEKYFSKVVPDETEAGQSTDHPLHYFTPFFKLLS